MGFGKEVGRYIDNGPGQTFFFSSDVARGSRRGEARGMESVRGGVGPNLIKIPIVGEQARGPELPAMYVLVNYVL